MPINILQFAKSTNSNVTRVFEGTYTSVATVGSSTVVTTHYFDLEVDYTPYYERLATALESIAADIKVIKDNSTSMTSHLSVIKTQQTTIAAQDTIIAAKQTSIETYQKKLKELAEGPGIRHLAPYDYLNALLLDWYGLSTTVIKSTSTIATLVNSIGTYTNNTPRYL